METQDAATPEQGRNKLVELRLILLNLHKALLDSERTSYEISHGAVASPAAFLQLLINDPSFQWLRPITTLIVQIDETLAAKKPPATEHDFEQLMADMRALFPLRAKKPISGSAILPSCSATPQLLLLHEKMEAAFAA